jgi:hypothetical protein
MNRRALLVLLATFAAALAVMAWLVTEMRTAAATAGPPPAATPASPQPR